MKGFEEVTTFESETMFVTHIVEMWGNNFIYHQNLKYLKKRRGTVVFQLDFHSKHGRGNFILGTLWSKMFEKIEMRESREI
jgi:hypothetical protein